MSDHADPQLPSSAHSPENETVAQPGPRPLSGHGSKFERKKEEATAALLTSRTIEEAARAIGVSIATLIRWMRLGIIVDAGHRAC